MNTLTKYKRAVRVAHKYHEPRGDIEDGYHADGSRASSADIKHERSWSEHIAKVERIEEALTAAERAEAIAWLSDNRLYGYLEEVC